MADQPLNYPVPQQDSPPRRSWPIATFVILALNLLIFLLETYAGGSEKTGVLLDFGAAYGPYFRRGEYWRLVMPIFLHIGWGHLLGNSYALFFLGPLLERVYGYGRYAAIYVAAGMGSALLSMTVSTNISAGASGAICGIAGAILVTGYLHRDAVPPRWGRSFGKGIIPFIVLVLASGYWAHGIDNWGHLGGLASGILLALVIPPPEHVRVPGEIVESPSQGMVVLPVVVVLLAMAGTGEHYRTTQAVNRLLAEGSRFATARKYDRALQSFQEAARRAPHDERPHEQLSALYLAQKQYDQALRECEEAIRLDPDDPEAQLRLGMVYRLKGDLPKAQQIFEKVLGKSPQTAEGQRLLADLYAEQKLYPEAIAHYAEALRLEPAMAAAHNNLAWLYATCEDLKYRDPEAALAHAQLAVELTQWKESEFIDTLAEAYFVNEDFQKAVDTQRKALALDPDNPDLQEHMARYRKAASI